MAHRLGTRPGDVGMIARSREGSPLGAAWYRNWTDADHSYGYVSEDVPELAIAVEAGFRGFGVGKLLLTALLLTAARNGVEQISLSVERDNPAAHLYRALGFRAIGDVGTAWTMVADVPRVT